MQCGILNWILEQKDISGTTGKIQIRFEDEWIVLDQRQCEGLEYYILWYCKLFILGAIGELCVLCLRFAVNEKLLQNKKL